jgi:hypothetical protein
MMFGDMIIAKAQLLGELHAFDAFVELLREREVVAIDVVEQAKFHAAMPPWTFIGRWSLGIS